MAVLCYVAELECWFTFVIKSVGMWLYVISFCNKKSSLYKFLMGGYSHIETLFITNVNQHSNTVT